MTNNIKHILILLGVGTAVVLFILAVESCREPYHLTELRKHERLVAEAVESNEKMMKVNKEMGSPYWADGRYHQADKRVQDARLEEYRIRVDNSWSSYGEYKFVLRAKQELGWDSDSNNVLLKRAYASENPERMLQALKEAQYNLGQSIRRASGP